MQASYFLAFILFIPVAALHAAIVFHWIPNKTAKACFFDVSALQAEDISGWCWMQRLKASYSKNEGEALVKGQTVTSNIRLKA